MKEQSIKNILEEIEYYEANGYHKIADGIMSKLIRIAYFARLEDLGLYFGDALANMDRVAFLEFMKGIPECEAVMQIGGVSSPMVSMDLADYINQNANGTLKDTVAGYQKMIAENNPQSTTNNEKLKKCIEQVFRRRKKAQGKNEPPQEQSGTEKGGAVPQLKAD